MTNLDKKRYAWQTSLITALFVVFSWFCVGFAYGKDAANTLEDDLATLSQLSQANPQSNQATATANSSNAKELSSSDKNQGSKTSNSAPIGSDDLVLNSPVIDEAHVLTDSEKEKLQAQILQIYNDKLAQIGVVIVPTTNGVDVFDYAFATAKRWKLGTKGKDNGILIFAAINDRKVYILTGYGVEGVLPDAIIKRIIRDEIVPAFKDGDYAKGISDAIAVIDKRLRTEPEVLAEEDAAEKRSGGFLLLTIIIAPIVGSILIRLFGRFLGSTVTAFGIVVSGLMFGVGLFLSIVTAVIFWFLLFVKLRDSGGGWSSGGGYGGGYSGGGSSSHSGGDSSSYSGDGGSFGGGGAGDSW